jgi:glycosyltransferase involved in cell wall biosynthesis
VLAAASAVVVTSTWSRDRLLRLHRLDAARVHVAEPGADPAALALGTAGGGSLLCVGAVTALKGHDVLVEALGSLGSLSWDCVVAGSLEVDGSFAADLRRRARDLGIADRVTFAGPLGSDELERTYAAADLLVQPSRLETYGMAVTEALARGLPVVATDAGGLPRTLAGTDRARERARDLPGLLVPVGDASALAGALRTWLTDAATRDRLRRAAVDRRSALRPWSDTALTVADALATLTP